MSDRTERADRLNQHAQAVARLTEAVIEHPGAARGLLRCAAHHAEKAAALIAELRGEQGDDDR